MNAASSSNEQYRILHVFMPFAAAYFLSYLMRSVNAVLSGPLTDELSLSAAELGLLSSGYFLTFAAMQIPLGVLLDRRGPKSVEAFLLIFAVLGCLISSFATSFIWLWIGRALIGLGVAACLMASYKAYRACFAPERQTSLASLMLMVGSFGALASTVPIEWALPTIGWRGVFLIAAGLFSLSAIALIALLPPMPEPAPIEKPFWHDTWASAREVFAHPEVRRLIPFAIFTHGGFMAVQGLWIGPWFRIVDGQSSAQAAASLLVLGVVVMFSHLVMSTISLRFKQWGWSLDSVIIVGSLLMLITSTAAVFNWWGNSLLGWSLMFFTTSMSSASYAKVSLTFPVAMAGRAITGINFIVFVGAFCVQWGLGLIADLATFTGQSAIDSLRTAFYVWLITQLLALVWLVPKRQPIPTP